jgi:hypothetical protein
MNWLVFRISHGDLADDVIFIQIIFVPKTLKGGFRGYLGDILESGPGGRFEEGSF